MTSIAWGKVPAGAIRRELEKLDPNPADQKLTRAEIRRLSAVDQKRVEELREKLRAKGLLPTRNRTLRVDKSGAKIGEANGRAGDQRQFTDISTSVSDANIVQPLFPDSLVSSGPLNYNEAMLATIRAARRFVALEGYELNRQDVVDLLIEKAKAGLEVLVVLDPADTPAEAAKAALIKKLRDQKLPNLRVAEYAVLTADPGAIEQILHVKKVICDTPSGNVVEVSGGINFNENSIKNIDSGWRTEGVAALDSLDRVLAHYAASTGKPGFDPTVVPAYEQVVALTKQRAQSEGLELVKVELAGAGVAAIDKPRDYSERKLRQRAKLGQKLVLSAKDVLQSGHFELVRVGAQNGSTIEIVEEGLTPKQQEEFKALKPRLKELGASIRTDNTVLKDESYQKLVYRELDAAIAARESIDIAAFALSDKAILDKLLAAHAAGCSVRVLVDDLEINGLLINKKAIAVLAAAGIPIRAIDRKAKTQIAASIGGNADLLKLHAKIMILGGTRVLGGSANFSKNGLNNNIEDGRLVCCKATARTFTEVLFDKIWAKASEVVKLELVPDTQRVPLVPPIPMNTKIADAVFIVFDFETTGFVPSHDERILGMCAQAVKVRPDGTLEVLETFNTYVTPGTNALGEEYDIPAATTRVHGLDKKTLAAKGAVPMRQALPAFVDFIQRQQQRGPVVMTGQNVPYDLRFLDHTLARKQLGISRGGQAIHYRFDAPYVDTVDVASKVFPDAEQNDLDSLIDRLQIPKPSDLVRHDAYADVVFTAQALGRMLAQGGFQTIGELLGEDMVQFTGPTLLRTKPGGNALHQLEFNDSGKLVIRTKDPSTGQFSEPRRVNLVEVQGNQGTSIGITAVVGRGQTEESFSGYVDAKNVKFRAPGRVFYALREQGEQIDKAKIIAAV